MVSDSVKYLSSLVIRSVWDLRCVSTTRAWTPGARDTLTARAACARAGPDNPHHAITRKQTHTHLYNQTHSAL